MAGDAARLLDDTERAVRDLGREDLLARLAQARARLARPATYVVVCGEFKKGKSSLVNALLGARVCATDADIATAVPTYVRYGPALTATALAEESPRSAHLGPVAPAAVEDTAMGRTDGGARALEVTVPRRLLQDGLVLVDTPGISGGLASSHAGVALRALALADVLVLVGDAGSEYGASEVEFLTHAASLCPRVVPVLTKTDLHPHWRRVLAADAGHLRAAGVEAALVPVSSPLRTAGLRAGDRALVAESGYPELAGRLVDAARDAAGSTVAAAAAVALGVLGQAGAQLTAERQGLGEGAREHQAAWRAARDQAAELRGLGARWQQVLFDGCADMAAEVELDLTVRVRSLRRAAATTIAELPPARLGADLGPWLQHRTNELLLDHQRAVREQAERVVQTVAEQFGSAAWQLREGLDLADDAFTPNVPQVALALAQGAGTSRFDLGLVALRGGSAGAMVSHAAGLVLGLAVPVVLPVAVVLSTVLAGRSWHSARTAQLRALRADTERAVVAYLEDVDTVARKDTRDAVRGLQRRVREQLGARAAELYLTATTSVESLAAAMSTGDAERTGHAARLDARLDEVEDLRRRAQELLGALVPVRA